VSLVAVGRAFHPHRFARSENLSVDDDESAGPCAARQGCDVEPDVLLHSRRRYFLIWIVLSHSLRRFSAAQDKDGAAVWTNRMRVASYLGIFFFSRSH